MEKLMSETTFNTDTPAEDANSATQSTITASPVPEDKRLDFLPSHFSIPEMMNFENLVFQFARHLLPEYRGGEWEYMSLSNGGLFLFPGKDQDLPTQVVVPSNGYEGVLPCQAAGMTVTLFALCYLGEMDSDNAIRRYHLLRDFICEQPFAIEVLRAID